MSIKLGTKSISSLYKGNKQILKILKGETLVYQLQQDIFDNYTTFNISCSSASPSDGFNAMFGATGDVYIDDVKQASASTYTIQFTGPSQTKHIKVFGNFSFRAISGFSSNYATINSIVFGRNCLSMVDFAHTSYYSRFGTSFKLPKETKLTLYQQSSASYGTYCTIGYLLNNTTEIFVESGNTQFQHFDNNDILCDNSTMYATTITATTLPAVSKYEYNSLYGRFRNSTATTLTIPEGVQELGYDASGGYLSVTIKELSFPSTLTKFGASCCQGSTTKLTFNQPASATITMPTAGTSGAFYAKSARAVDIYTDNETIKNYDWSTDNVTPTFYHLDGTAW